MPLKRGRSRKTISANIRELMRQFKSTGRIGATRPTTVAHARKISAAITFRKARSGR